MQNESEDFSPIKVGFIVVLLITLGLWGCPQYNVYSSRLDGQAKLAHAQAEREVQVKDAQGKLEAASLLAQADVERAKGVAQANAIIGKSLEQNEAYLKWLFIEGLKDKTGEVIYVPTETNLPILESTRKLQRSHSEQK